MTEGALLEEDHLQKLAVLGTKAAWFVQAQRGS